MDKAIKGIIGEANKSLAHISIMTGSGKCGREEHAMKPFRPLGHSGVSLPSSG